MVRKKKHLEIEVGDVLSGTQTVANENASAQSIGPSTPTHGLSNGLLVKSPGKAKHLGFSSSARLSSVSRSQEKLSLHRLCYGWLVGIKSFVSFFCSVQVLMVIICLCTADLFVQDTSLATLKNSMLEIDARLQERYLTEIVFESNTKVRNHISQLAKCAETLANRIRGQQREALHVGTVQERQKQIVEMPESSYLKSLALYFDAIFVLYATRESEYMHVQRTETDDDVEPVFKLATNRYNRFPNNISAATDSSTLNLLMDDDGRAILNHGASMRLPGYNPRARPFYNATRAAGRPLWTKPYVWISQQSLGIDACVPVYDSSGLPRIDPAVGADASGSSADEVWEESLAAVACCDDSLRGISRILANLDVGPAGVAVIVEAGGGNDGLLIGAAEGKVELPVQVAEEEGEGVQRLRAERYPEAQSRAVGALSRLVLQGRGGWEEVGEEAAEGEVAGLGWVQVQTALLDGTVPGWGVAADGRWSAAEYRMGGQRCVRRGVSPSEEAEEKLGRWVMVLAVRRSGGAELAVQPELSRLRADTIRNYCVVGGLCVLVSAVASFLSVRSVSRVLWRIGQAVASSRSMAQSGDLSQLRSSLSEVQVILDAFRELQRTILILTRYVPETVLRRDTHQAPTAEQLFLHPQDCTVLCCGILNFEAAAEDQSDEAVVAMIERHFRGLHAVASKYHGEIMDLNGSHVTVVFTSAQREREVRACRVAMELMKEQRTVRSCFGIYSGRCLVGNYGTMQRMKYGVVGSGAEVPRRLCAMASGYKEHTLLDCTTARAAKQVFAQCGYADVPRPLGVIADEHHGQIRFCSLHLPERPAAGRSSNSATRRLPSPRAMRSALSQGPAPVEAAESYAQPRTAGSEQGTPTSVATVAAPAIARVPSGRSSMAMSEGRLERVPSAATSQQSVSIYGALHAEESVASIGAFDIERSIAGDRGEAPEAVQRTGWLGRLGQVEVRALWALLALCASQIVVAVGVMAALQLPILLESERLLNVTIHAAVDDSAPKIMQPLVHKSLDLALQRLQRLPKCAEMLAGDLRRNHLGPGNPFRAAIATHSLLNQFDVEYAWFGTQEGIYYTASKDHGPDGTPLYAFHSNHWQAAALHNVTAGSMLPLSAMEVDDSGIPLLESAAEVAGDHHIRSWPRHLALHATGRGGPAWAKPSFWQPQRCLGIDATVPVYNGSSASPVDAAADSDRAASENGSLEGVAGCSACLDDLSHELAEVDLGGYGVAMLVECGGDNDGLLVGVAAAGQALAVAAYPQRLAAASYPPGSGRMVAIVSKAIVGERRRWEEVGNESMVRDVEVDGAVVKLMMRTAVLDGDVEGWEVGTDGRWSAEALRVEGKRWVLAIAIRTEEFVSTEAALEENTRRIAATFWIVVAALAALVAASIAVSSMLVRLAGRQLRGLRGQIQRVNRHEVSEKRIRLSVIREVHDVQVAMEEMRHWLQGLQRFIPRHIKAVLDRPAARDGFESCIKEGRLGMSKAPCTVMTILIPKLSLLAQNILQHDSVHGDPAGSVGHIEMWLDHIFQVVAELEGVVDDFDSQSVTVFWSGGELHGVNACTAALRVIDVVERLNGRRIANLGSAEHAEAANFDCFISVFTSPSLVGNYGTSERLKYGVSEWIVARVQKLARVAKTTSVPIIVSASTREAVVGRYITSYVTTTELGLLYALKREVNQPAQLQAPPETPTAGDNSRRFQPGHWIRRAVSGMSGDDFSKRSG